MPEGLSCLSQAQSSAYSASTLFRWFRAFSGPTCRRTLLSALSVSTCSEKRIQLCRFGIPPPECPLRDLSVLCSGSMIPDTNVGGKIATINEVSDDQKATFFFS